MKNSWEKISSKIRRIVKRSFTVKSPLRTNKYDVELSFWKNNYLEDNKSFRNNWYQRIMLAMAQERDNSFIKGKIIADFGCGPRGSLVWAEEASIRIGIDVLSDLYVDEFFESLVNHNMIYLKSTEKIIPLPNNFVDVMFTMNAIDHVNNFSLMCQEILRTIKPGGELIAGFNINEPPTPTEPQQLTEDIIKASLLDKMKILSYRITERPRNSSKLYEAFFTNNLSYKEGEEGFLWVRAVKI